MNIAVIPARGGSKRIPKKNIKSFCGKPIIAWSIEAALNSHCFDHVLVSTDDAEIAEVARQSGASVPFVRPTELSDDHTATIPVVRHALAWFTEQVGTPEAVCCIYATAPFLRPDDLRMGLQLLEGAPSADYAFPVTTYPFPIQRAVRIRNDERVEMFDSSAFDIRSQDLEEAWHDAGQFYWGRPKAWREALPIFSSKSIPIRLPRHRVQDIDTP